MELKIAVASIYALSMKAFPLNCWLISLLALLGASARAQQPLGLFEGSQDLGSGLKAGAATYLPATQQYLMSGPGQDGETDHDECRYAYKKLQGDFLLYARAEFVGRNGAEPRQKIGWLVCPSLAGKAAQVSAEVHGDGLTALHFRRSPGGPTEEVRSTVARADIIQLERTGTTFTMRVAQFGQPFVTAQVANLDLGDAVYVGLFVGSHRADVTETAVFRDVRLSAPVPPSPVPYQGYLGSRVEVLEIATGNREVVYTSPKSLQAPNWQRDGRSLLYNSDGLMYRLDLATRQATVVPTGEVKNNNNDHVLSFDGKLLGLSSEVGGLGGSIVYTVPAAGGTPRQVTATGPSYLHGWSPDGRYLLFIGQRHQEFDVYRIAATGGPEVRLTTTPGLDDGAEYTPDGQYIYFNSVRTGAMQIWRMKADGSQQQAVTTGDYYDWFPHISPDGKWIAFISFLKEEVAAGDHPFYKHVYLRLLPVAGGKPRVIAYVYGGQGTMNTPSWSPDSKKIAFVSNSADIK